MFKSHDWECRNILVCDGTEEAKQLSWGQGGERHKVATLEGTLFAKAGTITGGMAGNLVGRAQRWGDKEYDTLKKVNGPCLSCHSWHDWTFDILGVSVML